MANNDKRLIAQSKTAKPLFRFASHEAYGAWLADAPQHWRNWLDAHNFANNFAGKKRMCLPLPDEAGRIAGAIMHDSADDLTSGGRASHLPTGAYYCHNDLGDDSGGNASKTPWLFALGWALAGYRYQHLKKDKPRDDGVTQLVVGDGDVLHYATTLANATSLVRDLINTPANRMTPEGLEHAARTLGDKFSASIKVTKGDALAKNFPAIHAVGRSAEIPPRLIELNWQAKNDQKRNRPRITLIGKGVTFDSGGLNVKPASSMLLMKKDMGGAAHVLGLAQAIMSLGLDIELRVLIAAAENAISSRAMRPLDVIQTAARIPVEIGHTDAEGRLLLADMLYHASQSENDLLLDFATLTGAARIALGTDLPALFTNDDGLANALLAHAQQTHDPLWRMPLHAPYAQQLDTASQALSSTGSSHYGGAITAALFLEKFLATPQKWAHIDVMAWNVTARPARPIGGEAMGLRAVLSLIQGMAQ